MDVVVDPHLGASGCMTTSGAEDLNPPARSRSRLWIVRWVSIVVVLLAWEIAGRRINPLFMSYPTAIARAAVTLFESGELVSALASSLQTLVLGFVAASVVGVVAGLIIGRYRY